MTHSNDLLIGAHTSAQGGVHHALLLGSEIGATTIQLFTSNQRTWHGKPISDDEVHKWEEALHTTRLKKVMSHDSYLINLGSPDEEGLEKSRKTFREELHRCHQLKLDFLNFHPGAALSSSPEACLDRIIESLKDLESLAHQGKTRLLLEATAGQGSSVGHRFEQLAYIIEGVKGHIPIGVCIDTCHIFVAGYDIRTKQAWEKTLHEFDTLVGLKHLYAFHVNDSLKPLGSRVDRHASLGKGEIGLEAFRFIMTHPALREIPKYLETPVTEEWRDEISLLRSFAEKKP